MAQHKKYSRYHFSIDNGFHEIRFHVEAYTKAEAWKLARQRRRIKTDKLELWFEEVLQILKRVNGKTEWVSCK